MVVGVLYFRGDSGLIARAEPIRGLRLHYVVLHYVVCVTIRRGAASLSAADGLLLRQRCPCTYCSILGHTQ